MAVVEEFSFTQLLRMPKTVVAATDHGTVLVHRRGAADLVLRRADRHGRDSGELGTLSQLLVSLLAHVPPAEVDDIVVEAIPWTEYLTTEGRAELLVELRRAMVAAADLHTVVPVTQCLHEWQATAEVQVDAELTDRLTGPIEEPLDRAVPAP